MIRLTDIPSGGSRSMGRKTLRRNARVCGLFLDWRLAECFWKVAQIFVLSSVIISHNDT